MCRLSYARTVGRSPHWDLMFALRPAAATLPANAGVTPATGPQLAADTRCDDTPPCERPPLSPCCLLCAYLLVYIDACFLCWSYIHLHKKNGIDNTFPYSRTPVFWRARERRINIDIRVQTECAAQCTRAGLPHIVNRFTSLPVVTRCYPSRADVRGHCAPVHDGAAARFSATPGVSPTCRKWC